MLCHMMLSRLASTKAPVVVHHLDAVVDTLKATITTRVAEKAVKQEVQFAMFVSGSVFA